MRTENIDIIEILRKNIFLFKMFDSVYLFGSVLDDKKSANDVDLLLIYNSNPEEAVESIAQISIALEKLIGVPFDFTTLSVDEEKDSQFLKRIYMRCLKLK